MTARLHSRWWVFVQIAVGCLATLMLRTDSSSQEAANESAQQPAIRISADISHQSKAEDGTSLSVLRGNCKIEQGGTVLSALQMVVWDSKNGGQQLVDVYLEDGVRIDTDSSSQQVPQAFLQLTTQAGVTYQARWPREYQQPNSDPLLQRALTRRRAASDQVRQVSQLVELPQDGLAFRSFQINPPSKIARRIRVSARTGQPFSAETGPSTNTSPAEQIAIFSGGIKLNIDAPTADGQPDPNAIELAADSMVLWTEPTDFAQLTQGFERLQGSDTPLQVYLEGNIVVRQGDGVVLRAGRAYYDARDSRALMLDAEVKMALGQSRTPLRIRASRIRQLSQKSFHAQDAWMSASYFGKPGYRLESNDIFLEPRVVNPLVHQAGGWVDPTTGKFDDGVVNWVTTLDNRFYLDDLPVTYLPYLSGPAEDTNIPIKKASFKGDRVFGAAVQTTWDLYHILAINKPEGVEAGLLIDGYSRRGVGFGLEGSYKGDDAFGADDKHFGEALVYYVNDSATDILGRDRSTVRTPSEHRGRAFWRHRHEFPDDLTINAELGFVSDRNFLEQFYENEFDRDKDNETLLYLQKNFDTNWSGGLLARPQVNNFENSTQWLPKADIFALGEPLLDSWLTWTMHSSAGYGELFRSAPPTDPTEAFTPLPYYDDVSGGVFMTRHELDAPFNLGPVVISPYLRGEAAFWSQDLTGSSANRFVGTAGIRGSLTMWRTLPYVRDPIFNLNGLAHKMVFDFDYSYANSSQDISQVAQYNEFDDNAQERLRQRIVTNTFGGALPGMLDPRRYAIRAGAGELVSVPYHELVNDQQVLRLGWRHRLQTKVGPIDRQRIRDWMTLDLDAAFVPRSDRDNFGSDFGLLSARYNWMLSDRTTLLAGAMYDTFEGGQQLWHLGFLTQRSARGSYYAGVRQVRARGISSQIMTTSASYLLNPKWLITGSNAYDLDESQNRGQSVTLTRAGADWLFHLGGSYDSSKDSYGVALSFEPRFGARDTSSTQLSSLLGIAK